MTTFDKYKSPEVKKALKALGQGTNWICNEMGSAEDWESGIRYWHFTNPSTGAVAKAWYTGPKATAILIVF